MNRLLIVEDDAQIAHGLELNLGYGGYTTTRAGTVAEAWSMVTAPGETIDAILLDVGLPDGSGLDLCRRIRDAGNDIPILFLSARTDESTVVAGIAGGGDDYIRKPFGTEELKARIQKLLRKNKSEKKNVASFGPLTLEPDRRTARLAGEVLSLGRREFDILSILVGRGGDVVTREFILERLSEGAEVFDRTVDSHISHLRRKLRVAGAGRVNIASVYGVGYRLELKTKVTEPAGASGTTEA